MCRNHKILYGSESGCLDDHFVNEVSLNKNAYKKGSGWGVAGRAIGSGRDSS